MKLEHFAPFLYVTDYINFCWAKPDRSRDVLLEKYVKKEKTIGEIADELLCSKDTVIALLREYGIKPRILSEPNYGFKYVGNELVPDLGERRVVKIMQEYRATGFSL